MMKTTFGLPSSTHRQNFLNTFKDDIGENRPVTEQGIMEVSKEVHLVKVSL
jgi:hypothetical protein